jgi:hypothetical protein
MDSHVLAHICYLRYQRGWLLGELLGRFTAREIVDALGVINTAKQLRIFQDE